MITCQHVMNFRVSSVSATSASPFKYCGFIPKCGGFIHVVGKTAGFC